jgi:hypothetical protein
VVGQEVPASQPVQRAGDDSGQATSLPAGAQPIMARVIDVHGDVQHAPLGSREWQACKVADEYPPQTKIRTGIRSSVKFQIGDEEPYTALLVESVGLTLLSEAHKTQDTKRVRVGVGYGKIRAGVAEGGLKSDFTVDSPVATLSKRGTWNFALAYERATDRFEISLLDRGLVEALDKVTGQTRTVLPGQAVTQAMRRWLDESQIRRNVSVNDVLGQENLEIAFNRIRQDGLGVISVGGGQVTMLNLSTPTARTQFAETVSPIVQPPLQPPPGPPLRPEGFFGTGRGDQLIRVVIEANNPLAQRGLVRPGTYTFRRSALENWLRQYGGGR